MIQAKHHPMVYLFFKLYTRFKMKHNFNSVKIVGNVETENNAVLLIANHISWWDGFWSLYLSQHVFKKKYHFMMLEPELRKRWIFSYSGGFSIAHGAKSIIESLSYASSLLTDKNNLVLMFPQGKLHSMYHDEFKFQQGVERIISKSPKAKIVFLGTLVDYFEHPKPDLYFYLKEYNAVGDSFQKIEKSYREFFKQCVDTQKNIQV